MALIRNGHSKTRKEHRCWGCSRRFPAGTILAYTVSTDMGCIGTAFFCPVCEAYSSEDVRDDDTFGAGELRRNDPEGWEETRQRVEQKALAQASGEEE